MALKLCLIAFILCAAHLYANGIEVNTINHRNPCYTRVALSPDHRCHDHYTRYPYSDKHTLDKECKFSFTPNSKEYFTYKVNKFKYRFVNLRINFCNVSSPIKYTPCVVQPLQWVWTFLGKEGGAHYLEWPPEFNTLSLGMLKTYTTQPLHINVTVSGKCDIVIGSFNTTERLALAFAKLSHSLSMTNDQYNYSFWCSKSRVYIDNKMLYSFCQHVLCPLETIGYKCCQQIFNETSRKMTIVCPHEPFRFGNVWWVCPFVIGVLFYMWFGLVLTWILAYIIKHLDEKGLDSVSMDLTNKNQITSQPNETNPLIQNAETLAIVWINHNPITVLSIVALPIKRFCVFHPITTARVIRCLLAISSMFVVSIKVFVHYLFYKEYIIESVKQGAPKDFLSMIAGYNLSKTNFLVFLGGPFVALGLYVISLLILICIPKDYTKFMESGLPPSYSGFSSPLWMDLKHREKFGSRQILCAYYHGFSKIKQTMLANFLSLLNSRFWRYIISMQVSRYRRLIAKFEMNILTLSLALFVGIFYFFICIIEILLMIACFGLPTMFAITMVFKAYMKNISSSTRNRCFGKFKTFIIAPIVIFMLCITVYMFTIIFVDSFIFIAKVLIFVYTGLFVNPDYTEGWVVFGITTIMYIFDSLHSVNGTYEQLFVQTKKVCKRKDKKLKLTEHLYKKEVEGACIRADLYKYIIHHYKPIRVAVIVSIIKICVIIFCLYISLGILTSFHGFQSLNVVTKTATTIFVSLVPLFFEKMCSLNKRRKILRMRRNINTFVDNYLVYNGTCIHKQLASDEDSD